MPLVNFAVSGAGTGVAQTVAVSGADHVIRTDAYPAFGGQDAHPSPLAYTLASLSSCNQVTAQVVAKELGITIESVRFDVSADLDPTTMTTGRESADATFQNLVIAAEITTDAPADRFDTLRDEVARRCPVSVLFTRAGVRITNDWTQVKPA
ncbi:OsmC family protein [Pseudonocardia sp.]|uniref:OsmC family protein n=1 Tax=Pseudonocardia sp. TaxID=60912 RepID=UPI00263759E8|nr:OsmC family protein [Pseudonocardia sp.]